MKNKLLILPCIVLAAITIAATNVRKHECVVIHAAHAYDGIYVELSSSSSGAPKVAVGTPVAEAIATILDAGYEITHTSPNGQDIRFVK